MSAVASLLALLETFAHAFPEVAEFLRSLLAGDSSAIERVEAILPAKGESAQVADELRGKP